MGRAARSIASESAFDAYASELKAKIKFKEAREHAYRPALQNYVESLERGVDAINDAARIQCGAPDFIVHKKRVPVGYIEAKNIGESLDKVKKSDQGKRYFGSLSNLIITDYLEFRWYVKGEKRLTVRIGKAAQNKISFVPDAEAQVASLCQSFLNAEVPTIKTAEDLAHRLAGSTTNIYELIRKAYDLEEDKGWLHRWLNAFSEVLISDLDRDTFADMFAQTLAYGFFAARVHHTDESEFSRFAAAKILPKTNPFLRQLFAEFAGVNMPDEINWAVDEIIELLKLADMKSILRNFGKESAKDDPVVHFYETFLTAYDPSLREKRGVYYTPVPVVDYITGAVDEILETHFNRKNGLADDGTLILDPGVGTASFLYKVVERIHARFSKNRGTWDSYVGESLLERVFGFEILMAPYAVSHLKLGLQLRDTGYMAEVICLSPNTSNNGFVFPLCVFDSEEKLQLHKDGIRFNFSSAFLEAMKHRLGIRFSEKKNDNGTDTFGADDLFYYISAVLSSPDYQNRFQECLKVDFHRIPITANVKLFWQLVKIGSDVVSSHLMNDAKEATNFPEKGSNIVDKSEYDGQGGFSSMTGNTSMACLRRCLNFM